MRKLIDRIFNKEKREFYKRLEELKIIDTDDDTYYYPECVLESNSNELKKCLQKFNVEDREMFQPHIIRQIDSLASREGQTIFIRRKLLKENGRDVFQIINMDTDKTLDFCYDMAYTQENRELLTTLITKAISKNNVEVTFYVEISKEEVLKKIS